MKETITTNDRKEGDQIIADFLYDPKKNTLRNHMMSICSKFNSDISWDYLILPTLQKMAREANTDLPEVLQALKDNDFAEGELLTAKQVYCAIINFLKSDQKVIKCLPF